MIRFLRALLATIALLLVPAGDIASAREGAEYGSWDELIEAFSKDPLYAEWTKALSDYAQDPVAGGPALIQLAEQRDLSDFPSLGLVVIGDAYLRAGNDSNARRYFEAYVEEVPDPLQAPGDFGAYAYLGLGIVEARRGRLDEARAAFGQAGTASSSLGYFSSLLEAQTAAADGDYEYAVESLGEIASVAADDKNSQPGIVRAARVARANALMAAGEYDEALAAFAEIEEKSGDGLGPDERYAAAQARLRAGEPAGFDELAALVETCPEDAEGSGSGSRRMRELDPRAVLRRWLDNYVEVPFLSFAEDSSPVYAIDGCRLAAVTLARAERPVAAPVRAEARDAVPPASAEPREEEEAVAVEETTVAMVPAPAGSEPASDATPEVPRTWLWIALGVVVLAGLGLALRRRR